MWFEAKHKESKKTARAISSRKNICHILLLKNQLKMSYKFTQISKYSPSLTYLKIGRNLKFSLDIKQNLASILNHPCIENSNFVSWIEVKNIHYTTNNNIYLILDILDLPVFGFFKYNSILPDL
jgi:hypothetical protein